jgi:hypothetical protein
MQITPQINIELENRDGSFFITLTLNGTLTHEDYTILIPMIENSVKLVENPKINMLLDARKFTGWEAQAAWDDFKFGMEFREIFSKIAIVGTKTWQEYLAKMGNWFIDGEVRFFDEIEEAKQWNNS